MVMVIAVVSVAYEAEGRSNRGDLRSGRRISARETETCNAIERMADTSH
jgi:hypothetical protein